MDNLFDDVIKEPIEKPAQAEPEEWIKPNSDSPVENLVIKYLNYQKNRDIGKEIEDMKNDPEFALNFITGTGKIPKLNILNKAINIRF